jgi:hypothetical protein
MDSDNNLQLRDEAVVPNDNVLKASLGESFEAYKLLLDLFEKNDLQYEWRYYKDGKAWLCKVQKKKKTIVWMSAWKGYFEAAIYVPVRLLDEILDLEIDNELKKKISETKNVGKSKPCIFEIRDEGMVPHFEKVMLFKIKSK